MELKDLVSKNTEIEHDGVKYSFRVATADDSAWLQATFGEDAAKLFDLNNANIEAYSRLGYRLLDGDKSDYRPITETLEHEDGTNSEETVGGYRLFARRFTGTLGIIALVTGVSSAFVAGMPDLPADEPAGDKEPGKPLTGQKRSTRSVRNTGGRPKKS